MNEEKKVVRLIMITLSLTLAFVYVIFYQVKGDKFFGVQESEITPITQSSEIIVEQETMTGSTQQMIGISGRPATTSSGSMPSQNQPTSTISSGSNSRESLVSLLNTNNPAPTSSSIKILSGTILFYGELSIIRQLGITPQYILRDNKNIHYIFLGTGSRYDFSSIARGLGGNVVQLTTQAQIRENKLFGDRITFINLPEHQGKTVHMVVETNNQQRLIRIDFNLYHKSKQYLIDMFK